MDELDEKIIKLLKEDASVPITVLAKKLKIPKPTAYARLNRLKRTGVIKKFTILLSKSEEGVNSAILETKDFLISKMTTRTSNELIESLASNPGVISITKIAETKLLISWRGHLALDHLKGVEKITPVETVHWQD
ncbi:MAG: winged helix-turn-helix transcriptional regulator [Candidatus Micrarchaeota archaeon]